MVLKKINKLGLLVLTVLFSINAKATHLVGGQIEYRWLSGNSYEISVFGYRDCNFGIPGQYPPNVRICLFDKVTNAPGPSFTIERDSVVPVTLGDQCYTPPGLCVETHFYRDSVEIPSNPNGYYMMFALGARNDAIYNLATPGGQNMFWYTEMPDPALHNSSPTFTNYPRAYFCHSFPNFEDLSAVDIDGDSLKYYMEVPLRHATCTAKPGSGYNEVNYRTSPPHSFTSPLGAGSTVSMDENTGIMTVFPDVSTAAKLYVLAVRVEEWRNGVKIGEIRRDVQYTVLTCAPNLPPTFPVEPDYTNYTIAAGEELCFDIAVTDLNEQFGSQPANGVYFTYESEMFNQLAVNPKITITLNPTDSVSAPDTAKINVCIQTQCEQIRPQPYKLTIYGNDTSCYGINTIKYDLNLLVVLPGIVDLYPNVFTPNKDGKNDTFKTNALPSYCFDEFEIIIYNRWGNKVFQSNDFLFAWDGTNKNGKNMDDGVYYYTLKSKFQETSNEEKGFVHLIR